MFAVNRTMSTARTNSINYVICLVKHTLLRRDMAHVWHGLEILRSSWHVPRVIDIWSREKAAKRRWHSQIVNCPKNVRTLISNVLFHISVSRIFQIKISQTMEMFWFAAKVCVVLCELIAQKRGNFPRKLSFSEPRFSDSFRVGIYPSFEGSIIIVFLSWWGVISCAKVNIHLYYCWKGRCEIAWRDGCN